VSGQRFVLDEPPPEEPGMLMTSMIDVIFILLAFFVCVTELKKGTLQVDVPEVPAVDPRGEEAAAPIVVEVTADDRIFVASREAKDAAELERLLSELVGQRGVDAPVHLQGDEQARNGTMMRVVSQLSKVGLRRIEFAVQAGG